MAVARVLVKICYDNIGNVPYKGKNFNTNIWENVFICYLYD